MSITVSRYAYENGVNILRVEGVKAATINENLNSQPTKWLDVEFYSTEDLMALQDELNKTFPENIRLAGKFKEPEEDGLYLTCTGMLLYRDTEGDWSIRAFYNGEPCTYPSQVNVLGENEEDYETDWLKIVKKLGAKAFPLTHVSVTPIYK
nr:MAG TPA: hypothetical protein [Caudoviricetes sp.]